MSLQKNLIVLILLSLALLALAGCAAPAPTATPVPPTVAPTSAPAAPPAAAATTEASEPPVPNCPAADCTKTGPAITQNLKGDVAAGQKVFADNCEKCHGKAGAGGVDNPGSDDGTVPALNAMSDEFTTKDPVKFAAEIDAFIEHGSTPDGPNPKNVMDAWGDKGKLTPQQIADVIAYVMSLNK